MPETCIVCLGNLGDGGHDDSVSIEGDNASTTDPPPPMLSVHTDIKGYGLSTVISSGQTSEGITSKGKGKGKAKDEADESDPEASMHIAHLIPCGHNMHNECLKPWVERANSCPICRRVFNQVELVAYVGGPVLSSYPVQHRTQPVPDHDTDLSLLSQIDNEITSLPSLQTNPCPICRLADNEHVLLLCDGCDAPYHTYCIGLASVPPGAWFCEDCELQRAIALSMQEPLPASRTPTGRRTRGEVRRNRRRRGMERAQWTRVWRGVWNNMGFNNEHDGVEAHENRSERGEDEEIEFDDGEGEGEGDEYMRDDDIHDNASTYSDDEERQREIEEGTFGFGTPSSPFEMYEIRQQALADRRAEIQADRRAWERRLRVAESQGQNRPTPNGGNASRFADTQHTLLLRQAEHAEHAEHAAQAAQAQLAEERISRNWPRARPLEQRVKTPEPQTLEEMRAWELFDRAMAGEDEATSPARTPRGRKRRAEEDEGEKREDGGGAGTQENASAQPWRPLKRPRTRRPEQLAAMRNAAATGAGGQASASTSTSTSAAAGRSTAPPSAPTFLQTLLKEVEESALSPTIIRRPRPATVSRVPRSVIENSRASRSSANTAGAPIAAHSNSHSGSSSDCSSPRFFNHAGGAGGANGTAATPPTSVSESPFISPSGSPGDHLMTMFSPTEGGDSDVEMGGYQKSPTPINSRRAAVDRRHRHHQQQQQQQLHRHKHQSNQHQHQHHHPSSSSSRTHSSHHHHHHHQPTSPTSLSYTSKSLLQSYVSAALKPHHRRRTINSSQYTDINRRVSRSLYERAGMDEAVLAGESATADAAKKRWEQVAKDLVEAEIRAVFARKGPRVPIPRDTAAGGAEGGQGEATARARRTPVVVGVDGAREG